MGSTREAEPLIDLLWLVPALRPAPVRVLDMPLPETRGLAPSLDSPSRLGSAWGALRRRVPAAGATVRKSDLLQSSWDRSAVPFRILRLPREHASGGYTQRPGRSAGAQNQAYTQPLPAFHEVPTPNHRSSREATPVRSGSSQNPATFPPPFARWARLPGPALDGQERAPIQGSRYPSPVPSELLRAGPRSLRHNDPP